MRTFCSIALLGLTIYLSSAYADQNAHLTINYDHVVATSDEIHLKLTNDSNNIANQIDVSSEMIPYSCSQLRPGESCIIGIRQQSLPVTQGTITSNNSNPLTVYIFTPAALLGPTLMLETNILSTHSQDNTPGLQDIGNATASISNIAFTQTSGIGINLTTNTPSDACQKFDNFYTKCYLPITTDETFYGTGVFTFTGNVTNTSVRQGIRVASANLNFSLSESPSNTISKSSKISSLQMNPNENLDLSIFNTGGILVKPKFSLSKNLSGISLDSTNCQQNMPTNSSCTLHFSNPTHLNGALGILTITAQGGIDSKIELPIAIKGDLTSIPVPKFDPSQDLSYQQVVLTNSSPNQITFSGINFAGIANISLSNDKFHINTCTPNLQLAPNNTCSLWLHAKNNSTLGSKKGTAIISYTNASGENRSQILTLNAETDLYAGGDFTIAGDVPVGYIAKWDGKTWANLNDGLSIGMYWMPNATVHGMTVGKDGNLYVAGGVTTYASRYNGSQWFFDYYPYISTGMTAKSIITDDDNNIIASGNFGCLYYDGPCVIAKWQKDQNKPTGFGNLPGLDEVNSIALSPKDGTLFAGGPGIMMQWNGSDWNSFSNNILGTVEAITFDKNGNLFIGGLFSFNNNDISINLAKWDGKNWSQVGNATTNGKVNALSFDKQGNLYVGGVFDLLNSVVVNKIAMWDGQKWNALDRGIEIKGSVYTLTNDDAGNLYVGGNFLSAGGMQANNIAMWNGKNWTSLSTGTAGTVYALTIATTLTASIQ